MIQKISMLAAFGTLLIAGCNLRPRPFPWVVGSDGCRYEDSMYGHGSASCQSGSSYRCEDGQWRSGGGACNEHLPLAALRGCDLAGEAYSSGSASCQAGTQHRCDDGAWRNLALACNDKGDVPAHMAPDGRTCLYNGATVSTQSSICKSGVTYQCDDGEWRNLGTSCR